MDNKKVEKSTVTTRKPTRKNGASKGSKAAIITLSILLGFSILLGATAAFFSANANAGGTINLGDPVNVSITQGGATVSTLTFNGKALPGTVYDQPIGISIPAQTSDCVVRSKLTISNSDTASVNVEATTTDSWTLGDDGYYYYKGVLKATNTADFVTKITVPKTLTNEDANKTFALSVVVESIQYVNGAASEVWTTAPQDWLTTYGSGT